MDLRRSRTPTWHQACDHKSQRFVPILAPEHGQAEQIIEAAAVDSDDDHLGSLDDGLQRQGRISPAVPEFRAWPSIPTSDRSDFAR